MLHRYEGATKDKRKQKIDAEFVSARTEQVKARTEQAKMLLAKSRSELILKSLAEKQASYLLIALRQRILGIPNQARSFIKDEDTIRKLHRLVRSALNEVADLPKKVVDPRWMATLDENGDGEEQA